MSMSGRLALFSIAFIFLLEITFLVPALTFYRFNRLQERVDDAALVAEALLSTPNPQIDTDQSKELLESAKILDLAIVREDRRERLLLPNNTFTISNVVNLTEMTVFQIMLNGMSCITSNPNGVMLVVGQPQNGFSKIETAVEEAPICNDVRKFGFNLLIMSMIISMLAGCILFVTVSRQFVRPILFLTKAITNFQGSKNPRVKVEARSKIKEFYDAEVSLRQMQKRIAKSMRQKERLANLGESVAKIQHDLRNMLSTAHMVADNLEDSDDPKVRKSAPRLVRAIDRAIELSSQTLEYGRVGERKARVESVDLWEIIAEIVEEETDLVRDQSVEITFDCGNDIFATADRSFVRRIIQNLVRNARQILEEGDGGTIHVLAETNDDKIHISVSDNGPGMSEVAMDGLFQPFKGSSRIGGTGLGLAISKELSELMHGKLELASSNASGTIFVLILPK